MISQEIFYCDIPVNENYPATKLKCYAYKDNYNTAGINNYYKFCVDENDYLAYYGNCQIKTLDQENNWLNDLFYAIADTVFKKFNISIDEDDDDGFWEIECVPTMVFNYAYHDYDELSIRQ